MPTCKHVDVAIIGAGVAGLTLATRIMESAAGLGVMLIGPEDNRNQRLSFWTEQRPAGACEAFLTHQWQHWNFNHEGSGSITQHARNQRYVSLDAKAYKEFLRGQLAGQRCQQKPLSVTGIENASGNFVIHSSSEAWTATTVIDTRAPRIPDTTLKQQFWGCVVDLPRPHGLTAPVLMDFDVLPVAREGVTFIYVLPLSSSQLLVEATTFSSKHQAESAYHHCVSDWVQRHFGHKLALGQAESESGILPMGPVIPIEPAIPRCGLAGGAARSSTGYAFQGTERQAASMAAQLSAGQRLETRSPFSRKADWMDRVFLRVAEDRPDQLVTLFMTMARQLSGDEFAHFLSDTGGWQPCFRAIMAAPKAAFIRAAVQLVWQRSWS